MMDGLDQLTKDLDAQAKDYERRLQDFALNLGHAVVDGARRRVYQNLKNPKSYSPLAENIRLEKDGMGQDFRVITDKPYARFVEFGTQKSPARPFLTPASEAVKATYTNVLSLSGKDVL